MQSLARRLASAPKRAWPAHPVPIALVITELDLGGAERALAALASRIDRRRWHPTVIALGDEGIIAEPIRAAGIEVECLDVDSRKPAAAVARLGRSLRRRAPWLVQSFLFHANVATRLAAPLAGRPWVLSSIRVAEREKRWHRVLERLTAPLSLGSVCVSRGVLEFSRDVVGIASDRLTVIPNGIDTDPYDRAMAAPRETMGVPPDSHVALYVGRFADQKGLPFLLDAALRLTAALPDWHLVMVGYGPEEDALRTRAAESEPLRERVHWLGLRHDIPSLLEAADLFVLPSLWEGMPNSVLEAMAARRPVVATSVEGSVELVVPGETGWLVPPADSQALAAAMLEAAADPERLRRYGEAGRAVVDARFTLKRTVEAYESLWARVLGLDPEIQAGP